MQYAQCKRSHDNRRDNRQPIVLLVPKRVTGTVMEKQVVKKRHAFQSNRPHHIKNGPFAK
jgi:hypothetical protein